MVAGLFLVSRTAQGVNDDRNRVRQVVVHDDDGQTDAEIITAVIATLNTDTPVAGGFSDGEPVFPAGYFDTVIQIAAAPEGPLATILDLFAFPPSVNEVLT